MNARSERVEFWCSARATSSLPVPLSPLIRIVVRLGAACMIRSNTWRIRELRPMISPKRLACACRFWRSARFSATSRRCATRVAQDDQHLVVLERLGDVVERAALHRRDRVLDRRERGDHQHRQVVVDLLQLVERGDAVHAGHHHVDDGGVEGHRAGQLEPLARRSRRARTV